MKRKQGVRRSIIITLMVALMLSMMPMTVSAASKSPAKPKITNIKAGKVSKKTNNATVTVKWKSVKGASGYVVYEKHAADGKWRKVKTLGKLYTGIKIKKVPAGKYSVRVRAYKKAKGKKIYGKYSAAKSVFIKSKWNLKKSVYANGGKAEIDKINAAYSAQGASVGFEGNKMIITMDMEKIYPELAGYNITAEEAQAIKAELAKNKDLKKRANWLRNASGIKSAKLVVVVRNNGSNVCTVTF